MTKSVNINVLPPSRDDLVIDFGASWGLWTRDGDTGGWSQLHTASAKSIVTGDLDGNGIDEVIVDFGSHGASGLGEQLELVPAPSGDRESDGHGRSRWQRQGRRADRLSGVGHLGLGQQQLVVPAPSVEPEQHRHRRPGRERRRKRSSTFRGGASGSGATTRPGSSSIRSVRAG